MGRRPDFRSQPFLRRWAGNGGPEPKAGKVDCDAARATGVPRPGRAVPLRREVTTPGSEPPRAVTDEQHDGQARRRRRGTDAPALIDSPPPGGALPRATAQP